MTRAFLILAFLLSCLPVAAAGGPTAPLPTDAVQCNARQLAKLAARTTVARPNGPSEKSIGVAYTFSSPAGDFAGLAYTQQFNRIGVVAETPEHHLWFSTNPHEVRMLRNPARPALPTLSLTRNALNSDLVSAGDPDRFELLIDPTLGGIDALLHLDNLDGPMGRATSSKPGRGLRGVVDSCHDRFTAADLHVFALLAKTLRAFPFTAAGESRDSVTTIYRDSASEPVGDGRRTAYRIDVVPLDAGDAGRRSSFRFDVEISSSGRLGDAHLAILPTCRDGESADCTAPGASAMLVFSRPVLPGDYWVMSPATPSACTDDLLGIPGCGSRVGIPLPDVLGGSTWLQVR